MSKMIVFTYDDGSTSAVVTWSDEYGWVKAGDGSLLENITVEERESRTPTTIISTSEVIGPAHTVSAAAPVALAVTNDGVPGKCFTCGCPEEAHYDDEGDGCAKHGCRTFLE
jgi:hypothetical protein